MDDGIFYIDYLDTDGVTLKRKPISGPGKSIEYIVGTQSAATNVWRGATKDEALYIGKVIAYKLPVAGTSTAATLTLTLANGTTTAAIPVKRKGTGSTTTHYSVGEVLFMAYDGTNWQVNADYDSNTEQYIRRAYSCIRAGSNKIYPYNFILQLPDGRWESLVNSNTTNTNKTCNTHGFLLENVYLHYYDNTGYGANEIVGNSRIYTAYANLIDHRYSFNTANNSTNGTVANKPVYLVGSLHSDGLFYLDTTKWWTQTLPNTEDGKLYIYLGDAYDYYRMVFAENNPIYKYVGGKVQLWTQYAENTKQTVSLTNPNKLIQTATDNGDTVLKTIENSYVDYATGKITLGANVSQSNHETLYVVGAVAEGYDSYAIGSFSHAEGLETIASGDYSHTEGQQTSTFGQSSHAEGIGKPNRTFQAQCTNSEKCVYRLNSTFSSDDFLENKAIVEYDGEYYNIIEISSNTIRLDRLINNSSSFSGTIIIHTSGAFREASHVEGYSTISDGYQSHSEGKISRASGYSSHAEGGYTWAFGENSHAQGHSTKAFGRRTHTEGNKTIASTGNAHAEGAANEAQAPNAHAEGNHTKAGGKDNRGKPYGQSSHAEGELTRAFGDFSHAEGYRTKVPKDAKGAHTEGRYSYASGIGAHAEGSSAAIGEYSHAEGGAECISYKDGDNYGCVLSKNQNDNICDWIDEVEYENPGAYLKIGQMISCKGFTGVIENIDDSNFEIIISGDLEEISLNKDFIYILPTSSGYNSHAEGLKTIASGDSSHAEGGNTIAAGVRSHAEGGNTIASGNNSHAEGSYTIASGDRSHAEGNDTTASGAYSHAEGTYTTASGSRSHTEGNNTTASGSYSHAEGNYTTASGDRSHAEGGNTTASGSYSHAEGGNTTASGNNSHAEGNSGIASGISSHIEGTYYTKYNQYIKLSKVAGSNTCTWILPHENDTLIPVGGNFTSRDYSNFKVGQLLKYNDKTGEILTVDVINKTLTVNGDLVSISIPSSANVAIVNSAKQDGNHAEGMGTSAVGLVSHAEGFDTVALGDCTHAEGKSTTASGNFCHTEGYNTIAYGRASHAEGYNTIASRSNSVYGSSHAEGYGTKALGDYSHTEGYYVIAKGNNSHAEGSGNYSYETFTFSTENSSYKITSEATTFEKGQIIYYNDRYAKVNSITEGNPHEATIDISFSTNLENVIGKIIKGIAYESSSHIEGYNNVASGLYSHAEGCNTNAYSNSQHVFGKYNISDAENTYVEIVGNGTTTSSRSNARTLDWNGNEVLAGKLTVGANPTAAMDVVTKQYLENNTSDTKVKQTVKADNVDYKLLTTVSAAPTSGAAAEAGYGANLAYNPSTNTLKTGNASLTGTLIVTGQTTLNDNLNAQGITATNLMVTGNSNFVQIPTAPTPNAASNDTSVATTAFVKNSVAGLSGAMHFRGTTTSAIVDGSTTNPVSINGSNYTAVAGDVVLREISSGNIFEYVWTGSAWEMLGRDTSFKVQQTAVSSPTASGSATAFIDTISQDANGNITVTKKNLDTSGTWSGTAAKATQDGSGNNIVNTYLTKAAGVTNVAWDNTNKKLTKTINGATSDVVAITVNNPTLAWNTESTIAKIGTVDVKVKLPDNPNVNTDTLVKQTAKTDSVEYKILATTSASPTSGNAAEAAYGADFTINPSAKTITSPNYKVTSNATITYNTANGCLEIIV